MYDKWKLGMKNGKPSGGLITPQFRAAFVAVFAPKTVKGGAPGTEKHSISMLFPKDTDFSLLKTRIIEVAEAKWPGKSTEILRKQANSDKRIFKDQSEMVDRYAGFEDGCIYLSASNKKAPEVVGLKAGLDGTLISILSDDVFFSGCYAIASINPFAWEHPVGGKGVSLSLNNIQMIKTGDRLGGGRTKPSDDFEAAEADDLDEMDQEQAPALKGAGADPFA